MIEYAQYGPDGSLIRLSARASSSGDVVLTLSDGRSYTLAADTGTNDSHVVFEFALGDGQTITGELTHGGETYEHTMRIRQLDSAGMRIAVVGCQAGRDRAEHAADVMRSLNPDLLAFLGDFVYADAENGTRNGETFVSVRYQVIRTVGAAAYRPHYRSYKKSRQWKRLTAHCGVWFMWHDHEIFDGWARGSVKNMNKYFHPTSSAYDADVSTVEQIPESFTNAEKDAAMQAIYDAARTVFEEQFGSTNPVNTDAGIDADAMYFRVRVPGLMEVWVTDPLTYTDMGSSLFALDGIYTDISGYPYNNSLNDASRRMHYPTQQAWLLATMADSEAAGVPHKLLLLPTQPYEHNADASNNKNTLAHCTGERDAVVAQANAMTSVVAHSNDSHQAAVYRSGEFTCLNSASISSGIHQQGIGYNTNVIWKTWGQTGNPVSNNQSQWAFGVVDVTPQSQTHRIVDAHTARTLFGPFVVS